MPNPVNLTINDSTLLHSFLKQRDARDSLVLSLRFAWRLLPIIHRQFDLSDWFFLSGFKILLAAQHRTPITSDSWERSIYFYPDMYAIDQAVKTYMELCDEVLSLSIYEPNHSAVPYVCLVAANHVQEAIAGASILFDEFDHSRSEFDFWKLVETECELLVELGHEELIKMPLWDTELEHGRSIPDAPIFLKHMLQKFASDLEQLGGGWPIISEWYEQICTDATVDPFPNQNLCSISNSIPQAQRDPDILNEGADKFIQEIADYVGWQSKADDVASGAEVGHRDFFISYATEDEDWAKQVASCLAEVGKSCFAQFKDIPSGSNFVQEMERGLGISGKMIAIYSPRYWSSGHCTAEWSYFYNLDPTGTQRLLQGVRIEECALGPLARQIVWRDVENLSGIEFNLAVKSLIDQRI